VTARTRAARWQGDSVTLPAPGDDDARQRIGARIASYANGALAPA